MTGEGHRVSGKPGLLHRYAAFKKRDKDEYSKSGAGWDMKREHKGRNALWTWWNTPLPNNKRSLVPYLPVLWHQMQRSGHCYTLTAGVNGQKPSDRYLTRHTSYFTGTFCIFSSCDPLPLELHSNTINVDVDKDLPTSIQQWLEDIWISVCLQVYKNKGLNTMERNSHDSSKWQGRALNIITAQYRFYKRERV